MDFLVNFDWSAFIIAAGTLAVLETVLGIDNLIFLTIIVDKYPAHVRTTLRRFGLAFAMITRIGLLFSLSWLAGLTKPLFSLMDHAFSGRDLVLLFGGLFLLWKSSRELYEVVEGHGDTEAEIEHTAQDALRQASFKMLTMAVIQIGIMDIIFSLDSVITAIGMTSNIAAMITGVVIAMGVMLAFAEKVGTFVSTHPSVKVIALGFLVLIGGVLLLEGWGAHVPKNVVYAAMGFVVLFEALNMRRHARLSAKQR